MLGSRGRSSVGVSGSADGGGDGERGMVVKVREEKHEWFWDGVSVRRRSYIQDPARKP